MRILDLYIARMIVSTSSLCLLILTGLSGIIKWVDQLRLVGRGAYTMLDAGIYVLFLVPRDIEMFFPMAVLLGALIGMGMLASNSELVVMQVSGMSRLQITQSAMKTAIPLMIMVMALGEWGAPIAEKSAKELQATKISGGSLIKSSGRDKQWMTESAPHGCLSMNAIAAFPDNALISKAVKEHKAEVRHMLGQQSNRDDLATALFILHEGVSSAWPVLGTEAVISAQKTVLQFFK